MGGNEARARTRAPYPSDLSERQWRRIAPLLPPARPGGRPAEVDRREIVNAILYRLRSGCSWRMLPHDLPPWGTVHFYFRQWRRDGTWERVCRALRLREDSQAEGDRREQVFTMQQQRNNGERNDDLFCSKSTRNFDTCD
ncbi:MAG: hypothetical protein KatS3mg131_2641 [Candidatus Tectimicrobiota bacterium]|nr:MAG: hypothetical protein KatS3mg131_2641 [Candidatus Tectomicrobia bacterium]